MTTEEQNWIVRFAVSGSGFVRRCGPRASALLEREGLLELGAITPKGAAMIAEMNKVLGDFKPRV